MAQSLTTVFLLPGEHFAGDARYRISTLLGSCVSIVLWQPELRVGAMSHFLLPGAGKQGGVLCGRYAEDALALMLRDLEPLGAAPTDCQAKIFGGGAMFDPPGSGRPLDIGRQNGEAARAMLLQRRIRVASESLFDAGHRRIIFDVRSGEVWVKHARPGQLKEYAP